MKQIRNIFVFLGLFLAVLPVTASDSEYIKLDTKSDFFEDSRMESIVITDEGRLKLGPEIQGRQVKGEQSVYTYLRQGDSTVLGTGKGNLYRLKGESLEKYAETELDIVTDLLSLDDGILVSGASGTIYHVGKDGSVDEWATISETSHVWKMMRDDSGRILAVAGRPAKLVRIQKGSVDVLHSWPNARHAIDIIQHEGDVYVGTTRPGYLVRIRDGQQFVMTNFGDDQSVSSLATRKDALYVAVNSKKEKLPYEVMKAQGEDSGSSGNGNGRKKTSKNTSEQDRDEAEQSEPADSGEQNSDRQKPVEQNQESETNQEEQKDENDKKQEKDGEIDLTGSWKGTFSPEEFSGPGNRSPDMPDTELVFDIKHRDDTVTAQFTPKNLQGKMAQKVKLDGTFRDRKLNLTGSVSQKNVEVSIELTATLEDRKTLRGSFVQTISPPKMPQDITVKGTLVLQRRDSSGTKTSDEDEDLLSGSSSGGSSGGSSGPAPQSSSIDLDEESSLWRVRDGRARKVMNVSVYLHRIEVSGGKLFASSRSGTLYRLYPSRGKFEGVASVPETSITHFLLENGSVRNVFTADRAFVYDVGTSSAKRGTYTSRILDAETQSSWGRLHSFQEGTVKARFRVGNVSDFEDGGSGWSDPRTVDDGGLDIDAPSARYLQFRLIFEQPETLVEGVSLSYRAQNRAPLVKNVEVSDPASNDRFPPFNEGHSPEKKISWKASDPDDDALRYRVYYRKSGEEHWGPLTNEPILERNVSWDTRTVEDGYYRIRVTASDAGVNGEEDGLKARGRSGLVVVDNTQPEVQITENNKKEGKRVIKGVARDETSPIAAIQIRRNGGDWITIKPLDGISDSKTEKFQYTLKDASSDSSPALQVRVYDRERNVTVRMIR